MFEKMTDGDVNLNTSHVILYRLPDVHISDVLVNLNTSHVILYPIARNRNTKRIQFKYISCYSLSGSPEG